MNSINQKAMDQYMLQRIAGCNNTELAVLLLETSVKFTHLLITSITNKDFKNQNYYVNKLVDLLEALRTMLSKEDTELVVNLHTIYIWWSNELCDASRRGDVARIMIIKEQMMELKASWEILNDREKL